jgi:flagellar biosynthesis protein FlhB
VFTIRQLLIVLRTVLYCVLYCIAYCIVLRTVVRTVFRLTGQKGLAYIYIQLQLACDVPLWQAAADI